MSLLTKIAKPLIPVVLPIALAFAPQPAQAQKVYIEAAGEAFNSSDKTFQNNFGTIPMVDLGLGIKSKNDAVEVNFKIGEPLVYDTYNSVTMTETFAIGELDLRYTRFFGNEDNVRPFAGLEGSLNFMRDSINEGYKGQTTTAYDSGLQVGFGGGAFAGIDIPVDKQITFYGEGGLDFATIPFSSGGNFDASGFYGKFGVKYTF
jgi:hypothetical protein